jgi:hypothetical protein
VGAVPRPAQGVTYRVEADLAPRTLIRHEHTDAIKEHVPRYVFLVAERRTIRSCRIKCSWAYVCRRPTLNMPSGKGARERRREARLALQSEWAVR